MTGREREPQAPRAAQIVRQETGWQDSGASSGSPYQKNAKAYERIPVTKSDSHPNKKGEVLCEYE